MKINDGRLSAAQAKKINSIVKKNFPDSEMSVSSAASTTDSVCEQACKQKMHAKPGLRVHFLLACLSFRLGDRGRYVPR